MSLREKLRALEDKYETFQTELDKEIDLKVRIENIEKKGEKYHDEIKKVMKKRFDKFASVIDQDFQYYWDQWNKTHDSVCRTRANFLLHYMAVLKTRGYKKRRNELDYIASELDIPHFTPLHFQALVGDDFRARTEMKKIKRNTRIVYYCSELGALVKSDDELRPLLDFVMKHIYVCVDGPEQ